MQLKMQQYILKSYFNLIEYIIFKDAASTIAGSCPVTNLDKPVVAATTAQATASSKPTNSNPWSSIVLLSTVSPVARSENLRYKKGQRAQFNNIFNL